MALFIIICMSLMGHFVDLITTCNPQKRWRTIGWHKIPRLVLLVSFKLWSPSKGSCNHKVDGGPACGTDCTSLWQGTLVAHSLWHNPSCGTMQDVLQLLVVQTVFLCLTGDSDHTCSWHSVIHGGQTDLITHGFSIIFSVDIVTIMTRL